MQSGQMSTDGNYPSANGVSLAHSSSLLGAYQTGGASFVTYGVSGTLGGGASYKLQTQINDTYGSQWVDVANSTLSATGQLTAVVTGEAVRVVAANGTSPGTGNNTPTYFLESASVKENFTTKYPHI